MQKFLEYNAFELIQAEWIALIGLVISTAAFLFFQKASTLILFFLLVIGVVNLAQFETQFGLSLAFKVRAPNSNQGYSSIQLLSLGLVALLIFVKRPVIIHFFQSLFNTTEEDLLNEQEARFNVFLRKFASLSDREIERKLDEPLAPEAEAALLKIKDERQAR